jgi:hypothetical protein
VDAVLLPDFNLGKTATEAGKRATPATAAAQAPAAAPKASEAGPKAAAAAAAATTKAPPAAMPLAPAKPAGGARRLLGRGGGRYSHSGSNGYSQQYANTVSMDNTQRAIEAAASGSIPTSYATRYGSYQATSAAYASDCWNCNRWP